jgi:hypothetical protein
MEICYNQLDQEYRKAEGQSQSHLKSILKSPAHYESAKKNSLIPTPAMEMGTALHCRVLDGEAAFQASYIKRPDGINLSTKEGKEWKKTVGRKKILTTGGKDDPWNAVAGMTESLRKLDWFKGTDKDYIKHNEVSIYWDWEDVKCKARLDRVLVDEGIVLDLKTTDSVEPSMFQKKVVALGYDFQASYYAKAAEVAFGKPFRFIFVAVERRAPYCAAIYEASPAMMAEGLSKNIAALRIYKTCSTLDFWLAPEPELQVLDYPRWYTPYAEKGLTSVPF